MGRKAADLTGRRFGKLTVLGRAGSKGKSSTWWCTCDCGSDSKEIQATNLMQGTTISCGCSTKTHGKSNTRAYKIWTLIKDRCLNPRNDHYSDYGGRGIEICAEWRDSFERFYADMGDPPSTAHSIDRKDNLRGYQPGNCHWATDIQQNNNTRRNVFVEFEGKTQTIAQWASEIGISPKTLGKRLRTGWSVQRALTERIESI